MTGDPGHTRELLQRWHAGDREALDVLIRENLPWIHAYVRRKLGDRMRQKVESIDLVQDAMVQVMELGPRFQIADREHFRALLARIVASDIVDGQRWLRRQRRDHDLERPIHSDSVLYLDPPDRDVTRPSQAMDRQERREWVRLAIDLLDEVDQRIIHLRLWEKVSFKELGEQLGVSEDAARMRHNRALRRLGEQVMALRRGEIGPD
ncbi:MAG: sigma-70 family RNA polymerase sigma factor [Planctomycetes bacterium]|nr:sigma-70 family RNA polymerase sigma factor [Planctomycetota bacterium]